MGLPELVQIAHDLNVIAEPLGYGVTFNAGVTTGISDSAHLQFNVHRFDKYPGSGPRFDTPDEVRQYLDVVAGWPRWRLDVRGGSVEFDPTTDRQTGESFSLRMVNGLGISGSADLASGERAGAGDGATHLFIAAEEPPTVGRWYKSTSG